MTSNQLDVRENAAKACQWLNLAGWVNTRSQVGEGSIAMSFDRPGYCQMIVWLVEDRFSVC